MNRPLSKALLCILIGFFIYILPPPIGLDLRAWKLFAIFIATILGVILRPYPRGAITLFGLCIAVLTKTLDMKTQALIGFSSHITWLIVLIFFISGILIRTHLGLRIAYHFIKLLGKKTITLGYGITFTEFLLSPLITSNGARAGTITIPIVKGVCETLESTPEKGTEQKIGSFLMLVGFHSNILTCPIFLTSCAVNPLIHQFALDQNITITWMIWFKAAIVPALCSLLVMPLVIYFLEPPEQKYLEGAIRFGERKLKELGPLTRKEIFMVIIFVFMILLWIFEPLTKINGTGVAAIGVSLCLLTKVITINDILNEKEAWHVFLWFSILITMTTFLKEFGLTQWLSQIISKSTTGMGWFSSLFILGIIYHYLHYFFAGNTSQASAMYPAFLTAALFSGAPPLLAALFFGFLSSLYSATTHYGSAASPIYFSQRYVSFSKWWRIGFIMSVINLTIWFSIGTIWWKILGIW